MSWAAFWLAGILGDGNPQVINWGGLEDWGAPLLEKKRGVEGQKAQLAKEK